MENVFINCGFFTKMASSFITMVRILQLLKTFTVLYVPINVMPVGGGGGEKKGGGTPYRAINPPKENI